MSKILIVDDSIFMRKVLITMLVEGGYNKGDIIECDNGKDVMDIFEKEKPDLILLDIIMPKLDGINVIRKLGGKAKIIVISAVSNETFVNDAKRNGALHFVKKPFDKEDVLAKVKEVLST